MKRRRRLRVYELYSVPWGWSTRVRDYIRWGGAVVRVQAYSIRQAYYLAARGTVATPGRPGVLREEESA